MGGIESKIGDGEGVCRYKRRYQFMKEAVNCRNAFVAFHAAYAKSLRNTGAALGDYAFHEFLLSHSAPFSAASPTPTVTPTAFENDELEFDPSSERPSLENLHPLQSHVGKRIMKNLDGKFERRARKPASLIQIFADLDDHFLKASEGANEVSLLLVAVKMNFHSNFADNRGEIDHSRRVMDIITGSFHGKPATDDDDKDDFNSEENENYATLSDMMLSWEKKLYDEVKAGEIMRYEYQTKVAKLSEQKKCGCNPKSLEKLKASLCQLHARYTVDMQSVDTIVSEINHLRDDHLYPKLVQLVDRMATMWEVMRHHHESQSISAYALKSLDHSQAWRETSEHHFHLTLMLCTVVSGWHVDFCRLIDYQKDYIRALYNWLKLDHIPIDSISKENVSALPMIQNLPIHELVIAWNDDLDKLPGEVARRAISNFSAVVLTIVNLQDEEIKLRQKYEATLMEIERNGRQNQMKQQLEEEQEQRQTVSRQVRAKSLAHLKHCLPELFRAMSEFALACSVMYSNLKSIAENE